VAVVTLIAPVASMRMSLPPVWTVLVASAVVIVVSISHKGGDVVVVSPLHVLVAAKAGPDSNTKAAAESNNARLFKANLIVISRAMMVRWEMFVPLAPLAPALTPGRRRPGTIPNLERIKLAVTTGSGSSFGFLIRH
jgi:hypothetical protein